MKKFFLSLIFIAFSLFNQTYADNIADAQRAPITIAGSSLTLKNLINIIENQTNYMFVYSESDINVNETVSVKQGKKTVVDCLNEEGYFTIKFPQTLGADSISISYLGYETTRFAIKDLQAKIIYATYMVQYKLFDRKWMFDYSRTELKFTSKWDKKLFKDTYTITSEIAITDHSTLKYKIPSDQKVRFNDIAIDRVADFSDNDFWKDYNVIEPESGIENIISRIQKQLKRKR